ALLDSCLPHARDELGVVCGVERTGLEIEPARPSLAVHTRLASQRVDAHSRVVGEGWHSARALEKMPSLGECVLLECLELLEVLFFVCLDDSELVELYDIKPVP